MLGAYLTKILGLLPPFRCVVETKNTHTPVLLSHIFRQGFWLRQKGIYWPISPTSNVSGWQNVYCGIETCPGYMPGCYIQAVNPIFLGDFTQISANVGLISANHDCHDLRVHIPGKGIRIGAYSWIGMNSIILPDVELGDFTVVGAGSVVSKSFPEGYSVIAGNPARKIRSLDPNRCVRYSRDNPYNGFLKNSDFGNFRRAFLNV